MSRFVSVQLAQPVAAFPVGQHLRVRVSLKADILHFDNGGGVTFGPAEVTPESIGRALAVATAPDED